MDCAGLDAHLAQVGVQQNNDARTVSAWAALVAVPIVIAGVYEMRFAYVPELLRLKHPGLQLIRPGRPAPAPRLRCAAR